MKRITLFSLLFLVSACSSTSPAQAPQREQAHGNWQVMVTNAGKSDMLCYAGATPAAREGTAEKRAAAAYLMVTRRQSGKIEVSASPGYTFMPGSKVELAIDDDSYSLFSKGSVAWARSDEDDRNIVESLMDAEDIEVRGLSQAGLTSVDHYPPQGFAGAIARIRELCP